MLEHFRFIGNVGRFREVKASDATELDVFTLVYSENGRGKTTLCAILRSLASGTPAPLLERRRLSATDPSRVVVEFDGTDSKFGGYSWTKPGPPILVFDEHFVDANVHSGLAVDASHRQNLHELVIGEEGGRFLKRVRDLREAAEDARKALRTNEQEVAAHAGRGLSVGEFCGLPMLEDLEEQIRETEASVGVLRSAATVRDAPDFAPVALPAFDIPELEILLHASLEDVEQSALDAVNDHFASLGKGAEAWVVTGITYAAGSPDCPFCGQGLAASTLLNHYRAYFSEAYQAHRERVASACSDIRDRFGGDQLAAVQRLLAQARDRARFWSGHIAVPAFAIDSDDLARVWITARDHVLRLLDRKAAAPLESVVLDSDAATALDEFARHVDAVRELSNRLTGLNPQLAATREHASEGSLSTAEIRLARLKATRNRFAPEVDAACTAYLTARADKERLNEEKEKAREALDEHRDKVFGRYATAINRYLDRFHADFAIPKFEKSDAAGVPSATYGVIVNKTAVPLSPLKEEAAPSFKTALSAGDRNTLALAFFFALLEETPTLSDTVVVIDDPLSSLDAGRSHVTVQETRKLLGKVKQLVVLSHSLPLLLSFWERCDRTTTATLKVCDSGAPEESTIEAWDADADSVTDFDRTYQLVKDFAEGKGGDAREVAVEIRIFLERYLRVAFRDYMPPGRMLRAFIDKATQLRNDETPILSDRDLELLEDLRDYTWSFHHENPTWRENVANVNGRQLKGYAQRAIEFIRLRTRSP